MSKTTNVFVMYDLFKGSSSPQQAQVDTTVQDTVDNLAQDKLHLSFIH